MRRARPAGWRRTWAEGCPTVDGGKRDDSGGEKDHRVHQVLEGGQTVAEMAGGGEERGQPLQGIRGRREGVEEGVETHFVIFQSETILGVNKI